MPTYNNPALGQSFENIAAMFAPPSAGDLASYAQAASLRQRNDIIEKLRSDPHYAGADAGVLANLFDPTNSWAALDANTATARRGQDIAAQTSRANNLQDNRFGVVSKLYGPLDQGQVRPELPASIAGQFDLPAMPQVAGAPKPLTEDQVKGGILQRATPDTIPTLTDQQITALTMGNTPTQNIVGPNGPQVVYTPDAVGQQPYFNKGAEAKPELYNYWTPDNRTGTATLLDDGKLHDTQSGAVLPEGTRTAKVTVQGTAEQAGLAPTVANTTDIIKSKATVTQGLNLLDKYEQIIHQDPSAIGLAGTLKGIVQDTMAVSQDLASAFGGSIPQLQEFANEMRTDLSGKVPELFDPQVPAAKFYLGALAYALARTENPDGEVSRQAYDRAYERVSGGLLANSQGTQAAVDAMRQMFQTRLDAINAMQAPDQARTDVSYRGPAGVPTPQTQADFDALPSGATYIDPEDGKTYRKP